MKKLNRLCCAHTHTHNGVKIDHSFSKTPKPAVYHNLWAVEVAEDWALWLKKGKQQCRATADGSSLTECQLYRQARLSATGKKEKKSLDALLCRPRSLSQHRDSTAESNIEKDREIEVRSTLCFANNMPPFVLIKNWHPKAQISSVFPLLTVISLCWSTFL